MDECINLENISDDLPSYAPIFKEVEDYIKRRRIALEEMMFDKFYFLRIEQSRKFIELIKTIEKNWADFVAYFKSIGEQGGVGDGDSTYCMTIYDGTNPKIMSNIVNK